MKRFRRHFPVYLTVGSIVILWTLIVAMRTGEARSVMKTRLAEQRQSLDRLSAALTTLQTQQREARELSRLCAAYKDELPPLASYDATLASIKQLADFNALVTEPARLQPLRPMPGVTKRTIQLTASGSFNGFYAFLTQLETTSPSIVVTGMELHRLNNGDAELSAKLTIDLLFHASAAATSEPREALGVAQ